jgi:chondroitin AC lyase
MSFHHRTDNVISTLTYGTGYAGAFAYWSVKIAGTKFTFPEDKIKLLIDYYLDGISKSMPFGMYPDLGAMNRDLSRKGALDLTGTDIPENLLRSSDYRKAELEELINVREGKKQAAFSLGPFFLAFGIFFAPAAALVFICPYAFLPQNNMEEPHNEEGLRNHHFADGANFVSRTGKEYFDIFPVWDWQKIPGATIVQKPALPPWKEIAKKGLSTFTGAVTDGEYGAAAIELKSVHDNLEARKSWFFFDHEYVCLGAAICSEENFPVATTLNQCLLNGAVVVKTKTGREVAGRGSHSLKEVSWVLHDSIGYLFPAPVSLNMSNTTASGNWRQISHQSSATEELVQKDVFTAWLDHGRQPSSAGYAYIVVPAITENLLDQYRKKPGILILANTAAMQAVYHHSLNICQVVFLQSRNHQINKYLSLTSDNPGIVMIRLSGQNKITNITLSDPTHQLKACIYR